MKLRRVLFKVGLALCLCLCAVSAVWAADPEDALRAAPEKSVFLTLRLEDLGGLLRWALSEENLKVLAPAGLGKDDIQLLASMLEKTPVRSAALSLGTIPGQGEFLQAALSINADMQSRLDLVAKGTAKAEDIAALLLGEDSPVVPMAQEMLEVKSEGGLLTLNDAVTLGAKDGLLLLGLTADDVKAGLAALEDGEKRLSLKRRFTAGDFALLHMDFDTLRSLALSAADDKERAELEEGYKEIQDCFRAPLDIELSFESLADRFLVSLGMNLKDALAEKYAASLKEAAPVTGGHIRLLGAGSPMFALGTRLDLDTLKESPTTNELWKELVAALKALNVSEADLVKLVSGGLSIVLGGGTATFEEIPVPALYLTQEGRDGVAASLLDKAAQKEKAHLNPIQAAGWDRLLQLDSSISPVPCLVGTQGETLLLGMIDAASLEGTPAPSPKLQELLARESLGSIFLDFEAVRSYLKEGLDGPLGAMAPLLATMAGDSSLTSALPVVKDVLDAKLSVPSVSAWGATGETFFLEFATVDVPPGEGLLAKLSKAYAALNRPGNEDGKEKKKD